ncbi:MAG: DUF6544 family protein [Melioribacteraceae bacterium]
MKKSLLFIFAFLGVMLISYFLISAIGEKKLRNLVEEETAAMFGKVGKTTLDIVTEREIKNLPEPVKRWLRFSGVIGKERVLSARIKQRGSFRMSKEKGWIPFEAEEYFTIEEPAFLWYAKMEMAPFFYVTGRDYYFEGKGNMLIKMASIVTIADAKGEKVDQGSALRFLNEIMWFPSAALSDYIYWEEIDNYSSKAIISFGDVTASAVFFFDERGALKNMQADRYSDVGEGKFSLEKWTTPISGYKKINNILLPYKGSAVWQYKNGDFEYIKLEVTDIEYNNPVLYER